MIKLRIEKGGQCADIRFPCEERTITDALNHIGVADELDTKQTESKVVEFDTLSLVEGQTVDLDEINFFVWDFFVVLEKLNIVSYPGNVAKEWLGTKVSYYYYEKQSN